jgi:hypothetical protein
MGDCPPSCGSRYGRLHLGHHHHAADLAHFRTPQGQEGNFPSLAQNGSHLETRAELRHFLNHLQTLRTSASSEFELRGPFPDKSFQIILGATSRILDSFHALNVIILREFEASEGEREVLKFTRKEWTELSWRISHLFSGESRS